MERIRRSKVALWAGFGLVTITLASLLAVPATHQKEHPRPVLLLKTGVKPGSLTVRNESDLSVEVERALGIEMKSNDRWTPIAADFELISNCAQARQESQHIRIPAKTSISVVAWTGFSCSGQCAGPCRANVAYGPGTYRFVATLTAGNEHIYSDPFELPKVK